MGATDKQGDTKPMGQMNGGPVMSNREDCEKAPSNWDDATAKCAPGAVGGGAGAGGAGGAGGGAGGAGGGG